MDGTHRPINKASSVCPKKKSTSDTIRERNAANSNSLSVMVKFLNIILIRLVAYNIGETNNIFAQQQV